VYTPSQPSSTKPRSAPRSIRKPPIQRRKVTARQDNNGTDPNLPPFPPDFFKNIDDTSRKDITDDVQALVDFYQTDDFDKSDIDELLQWFEDLDFIDYDGTVRTEPEDAAGHLDKRQRLAAEARQLLRRRILQKRGWGLFEGIYNATKALVNVSCSFSFSLA
jgi:hypothetical protein